MPNSRLGKPKYKSSPGVLDDTDLVEASGYVIKYEPHGASLEVFHDHSDEICVVGPKGTGKSLGLMQKLHLVLSKYPGSKGFMARKTRTSMTNSCIDMFNRFVLKPADKVGFHKTDQQYNYPNESMLAVIGLDNVDRLNSSEWDIGYAQEVTEWTENDWEICGACIRHGVVPYQQFLADCNPDKPAHWMKVRIDKGLTKGYKSYHKDNPKYWNDKLQQWTPEGDRYIKRLSRLSGVRYKRLYIGEWAAAEGVVYDTYDPNLHLISKNELPLGWEEWPRYWAFDFGFTHPFVWQDWVEAPWGALYLVRELYHTQMLVEDAARIIRELNHGLPIPRALICDHDAEGRAVLERHLGLLTLPAYKSIQPGIQAVQARLLPELKWGGKPGIFIVRDIQVKVDEQLADSGKPISTEQEIEGYAWDKKRNELVNSKKDEIPLDLDNHGMDCVRYVISFVDDVAEDPQEEEGLMTFEDEVVISLY